MAGFKKPLKPDSASVFRKTPVDLQRVADAQAIAAISPLVDDPRTPENQRIIPVTELTASDFGARQNSEFSGTYEVGQIYDIPLARIKSNPLGPRVIYTSSAVDEMSASLTQSGQHQAVTAFVNEAGDVIMIDGETRLRGARAGGLPTLRVEIRPRPINDRALYESARNTNRQRSEQSPLDDALRWKELLSQGVYPTQGALAQALGVSMDVVSRTLSLAQLPQRILHALADESDLLKLRVLNALREFWEALGTGGDDRDDKTLGLIHEVARKGLGYREIESRRKGLEKGPTAKPRAMREPLQLGSAKGELKTFPDGRLELSLKGLSDDQAEDIRLKLSQTLKAMAMATTSDTLAG